METMPKRINVMKVISYDVEKVMEQLNNDGVSNPSFDDILERVREYTVDDFSCGWGHEADPDELTYQDENGEEL